MSDIDDGGSLLFPLVIAALGILGSFITTFAATNLMTVDQNDKIESTLKWQLIISSILLTPLLYAAAVISLPEEFQILDDLTIKNTPN